MEDYPEEHIHEMGKRTFEDGQQDARWPGSGFKWWLTARGFGRGAVRKKVQVCQQTSEFPHPEAGECHHGTGVSGEGRGN